MTGFLLRRGFVRELVPSTLGRLLEKEGVTFQRTKGAGAGGGAWAAGAAGPAVGVKRTAMTRGAR